jgi:superfamily II DNA helicase RecQ
MPRKCPIIAMSATFTQEDQDRICELLGREFDYRIWTDMNKRRIHFDVVVSGNPTQSVKSAVKEDLTSDPEMKIIIYTNSRTKAEESLVPSFEAIVDKLKLSAKEVMSITGDDGLMAKVLLMAAFSGLKALFDAPQRPDVADTVQSIVPPNLSILAATSAANCGISSKLCRRSYRIGPPPDIYDLVQEMGRCDRDMSLPPGANRYEIHLSFPTVLSLYIRIMRQESKEVRERELLALFHLLSIVIVPRECFHVTLEKMFEEDTTGEGKVECEHYCSFCTGEHRHNVTNLFRKLKLTNFLIKSVNGKELTAVKFIAALKKARKEVFHPNQVPENLMGPIHGLAMQLLANTIIKFAISESGRPFIGTKKLESKHVVVVLGEEKIGNDSVSSCLTTSSWEGLYFCECEGDDLSNCPCIVALNATD